MKLVFTRNELVLMVKTTMSLPGLMKKFLTDDYIISTFENKMLELTTKTTAIKCIKGDDDYTIAIDELFTIELINEFGSLVNAMITLTMGAGARMKMIADKYKVKEDDIIKNNIPTMTVAKRDSLTAEYGVYGIYRDINDIIPYINNNYLIKYLMVINNQMYHKHYYKTRIRHQLDDGGYIDGLILIDDAIYALYSNRDETKVVSIHNVKPNDLGGFTIDTHHILGELNMDGIILLKQMGMVNPKEIYYLFFNSIDDIKKFLISNSNCSIIDVQGVKPNENIKLDEKSVSKRGEYNIFIKETEINKVLSVGLEKHIDKVGTIKTLICSNNNTVDIGLYDSCKLDIPVDTEIVLEAIIMYASELRAIVRDIKSNDKYIAEFYFRDGYINVLGSGMIPIHVDNDESIYIDCINNHIDKRYYLFFNTIDTIREFYESNISNTESKE